MIARYTATEYTDLIPTHKPGVKYTIRFNVNQFESTRTPIKTRHQALAGNSKTVIQRVDRFRQISTPPIRLRSRIAEVLEFLSSVEGGEEFELTFEEGNGKPQRFKMIDGFTQTRVEATSNIYSFSFKVEYA